MKFEFIKQGTIINSHSKKANCIYLDVGNSLEYAIIDHHQFENPIVIHDIKYECTAQLVEISLHLIPNEVETCIVHENPDFDCWLATYLVKYYLTHKSLPKYYKVLTSYAALHDQGKANYKGVESITSMIALIPFVVRKSEYLSEFEMNLALIDRGILFIDYLFQQLGKTLESAHYSWLNLDESILDLPGLFDFTTDFFEEIELGKNDYQIYLEEIENPNKTEICQVIAYDFLKSSKEYVDSLLWKEPSLSLLNKYWARNDTIHCKHGFVVTSIPIRTWESEYGSRVRVVISTNPNTPYSLKGLGKRLEEVEVWKELQIARRGDLVKGYQTRQEYMQNTKQRPRYEESWCVNHDPWYDGRAHHWTIIDSPSSGSQLTIEEIHTELKDYLAPRVIESTHRILFPFTFRETPYKIDLEKALKRLGQSGLFESLRFTDQYFEEGKFHSGVESFLSGCHKQLSVNAFKLKQNLINVFTNQFINFKVSITDRHDELYLFKNGNGFYCVQYTLTSTNHIMEESLLNCALNIQKQMVNSNEVLNAFLNTYFRNLNIQKGISYSCVVLDDDFVTGDDLNKLLYKFSNNKNYSKGRRVSHRDEDAKIYGAMDSIVNKLVVSPQLYIGFSQRGLVECCLHKEINAAELTFHKSKFFSEYFIVFLIALSQSTFFVNVSEQIKCMYKSHNSLKTSVNLKSQWMEYLTQGHFFEVSSDTLMNHYFDNCKKVFLNDELFKEVENQIKAFDSYIKDERSRKIGIITSIFLPTSIIEWFISFNIIKLADGPVIQMAILGVLASISVLSVGLYVYISKITKYK